MRRAVRKKPVPRKTARKKAKEVVTRVAANLRWILKEYGPNKMIASKNYSSDQINIEILEDGTVKTWNGVISGVNHASAEQFVLDIARGQGGEVTKQKMLGVNELSVATITQ